jgi:hypothetical protein
MKHPVPAVAQIPPQKVLENERPEVADVRVIVNCRPAGIQADYPSLQGTEFFLDAGQGIVQSEHDSSPDQEWWIDPLKKATTNFTWILFLGRFLSNA